jgi:aryl-alcohol dehydrogenase-like predicted oxidoreductase
MERRALGSTGLSVTPVGFGLAAVGRPGYINLHRARDLGAERTVDAMERRAHDVLDAGYAAGVRYFDAARSYGRAEAFLASWLDARRLGPADVTVGSKWGYRYTADWRVDAEVHEVKEHSLATLERQVRESRALLGDRLRLYQIHSATLESGVLENVEVLRRLARLSREGLVIGMSVSGSRQADVIRRALEVDVNGSNPFRCVQATWNLLERSAGAALEEAHEAGWGVIVKEAMANGRLAPPDAPPEVERVAASHGVTSDRVAIACALANPWVDVVLSGAATPDQLRSNVSAAALEVDADLLAELAPIAEPAEIYWATRAGLPWS